MNFVNNKITEFVKIQRITTENVRVKIFIVYLYAKGRTIAAQLSIFWHLSKDVKTINPNKLC